MPKFHKSYGNSVSILDTPTTDETAREIETIVNDLDNECTAMLDKAGGICRYSVNCDTKAVDGEINTDVSIITDNTIDRDGDSVLAKGGDLRAFRKNPVVLWAHDYSQLPIGKALHVRATEDGLGWRAKTQYAPRPDSHEGNWFASDVFAMVKGGFLNSKSIGFIPTKIEAVEVDKKQILEIKKWVLLEYSAVPVPANSSARVETVGKGYGDFRELVTLAAKGLATDELIKKANEQAITDYIKEQQEKTNFNDLLAKSIIEVKENARRKGVLSIINSPEIKNILISVFNYSNGRI